MKIDLNLDEKLEIDPKVLSIRLMLTRYANFRNPFMG